jgi:hypothetical protein
MVSKVQQNEEKVQLKVMDFTVAIRRSLNSGLAHEANKT